MSSSTDPAAEPWLDDTAAVSSVADLAAMLRALRRREARQRRGDELTYHQLAERTGWPVSTIGEYLAGSSLPSTARFDILVQLLGARGAELQALCGARDRVAEARRRSERRSPEAAAALSVPAELPATPAHFVGRDDELGRLDLAAISTEPDAARIAVVTGMGGVGKSALALRWAHRVAERFPDGQLFVNLRGYDPVEPVDPTDALAGFLRSLGVSAADIPLDLSGRAARYRTLLSGRRMLIVLDNARDAEQVRPLLPGGPLCMVVVTSRDVLAGTVSTEGAVRIPVEPLLTADSTALLHRLVGDRVDATPESAESLASGCGGLPLAIRIAADVAARRADLPLSELIEDLRDERLRLEVLDTGDARTAMRSVFSWSYRLLSPDGARLFRLFSLPHGPDLSTDAVACLAGLTDARCRRLLAELTRSHMLTETTTDRYAMHDVLRAYAAELAHEVERGPDRGAAVKRFLDRCVGTAAVADRTLHPKRLNTVTVVAGPPDPGFADRIDSPEAAQRWFDQERSTLLAAVPLAVTHGHADHAWQLPWAMATYLDRGGYWHEWAAASAMALEVTTDPAAQAQLRDMLAKAARPLGLLDTALEHYRHALELLEGLGDQFGQAVVHSNLVGVNAEAGRIRQGVEHGRLALALFRDLGNVGGQANALNNLAMGHYLLGEYAQALPAGLESLALTRERGDRHAEADVLDTLGRIHRGLGEHDRAIDYYLQALKLYEETSNRPLAASGWMNLGDAYADVDQHDAARHAWQTSLALLDDLGSPDTAAVRLRLETGTPPR